MRPEPPLSPCVMVVCAILSVDDSWYLNSLELRINGNVNVLVSLLSVLPHLSMICTLNFYV